MSGTEEDAEEIPRTFLELCRCISQRDSETQHPKPCRYHNALDFTMLLGIHAYMLDPVYFRVLVFDFRHGSTQPTKLHRHPEMRILLV